MSNLGVLEQFDGYFELKEIDWDAYQAKYQSIYRMDRILKAEGKTADEMVNSFGGGQKRSEYKPRGERSGYSNQSSRERSNGDRPGRPSYPKSDGSRSGGQKRSEYKPRGEGSPYGNKSFSKQKKGGFKK